MTVARAAVLLLCTGVSACSAPEADLSEPNILLRNDFESLEGWTSTESPSLTRERAHSGRYAIKTDQTMEYSLTYSNLLGRLAERRIIKIEVAAWVYATKPADAQLVVQINRSLTDNTPLVNQVINLGPAIKTPGEWSQIRQEFTMPATISSENQLRIYLWRVSAPEPIYLDDLVVTSKP